jgi:prepilin-type N-terminal cleavage/methylation domain-containing protein
MISCHPRCGFTLIEIMVSIMIFVVVALAMIAIMLLSSDVYREGEYGRSANDETVGVLGTFEEDLKRLLPPTDGGFVYSVVLDNAGNTLIAFAIANPDPEQVAVYGNKAHQLVAYWVDDQRRLMRAEFPLQGTAADNGTPNGVKHIVRNMISPATPSSDPLFTAANAQVTEITNGCLYLGAWLASQYDPDAAHIPDDIRRPVEDVGGVLDPGPIWESATATDSVLGPWGAEAYDTDPEGTPQPTAHTFPSALRISVTLTGGGRFAPTGRLMATVPATGAADFKIVGAKSVPSTPGSVMRVDDEWIRYSEYRNGVVHCEADGRGARRSVKAQHDRYDSSTRTATDPGKGAVLFGQTYNLVRTIPR